MDGSESEEEFLSADEGDGDEDSAEEHSVVKHALNEEPKSDLLCTFSDHVTVNTNNSFQPESSLNLEEQSLNAICPTLLETEQTIDVCKEKETKIIIENKDLEKRDADGNKINVEKLLLENTCIDSNLNSFNAYNETLLLSKEGNVSNEQKSINGKANLKELSLKSKTQEIFSENHAVIAANIVNVADTDTIKEIEKGSAGNLEQIKEQVLQEKINESFDIFEYNSVNKQPSDVIKCNVGCKKSTKKESNSEIQINSSNFLEQVNEQLHEEKASEQLHEEKVSDSVDVFEYSSANKQSSDVIKSNDICNKSESSKVEVASKLESSEDWAWDSWAEDIIQQATNKVTVLVESLEDKLGIPDPVEMAKFIKEESESNLTPDNSNSVKENVNCISEKPLETNAPSSGFSSWLSSLYPITSIVQATGQDLVSGSIGALEFIGKKTVDILSDGDPGLRSVRQKFEKKTLSMVLNDAKLKYELNNQEQNPLTKENNVTFDNMFERYQGSAHLDALVMLSNECEKKLQRILTMQSDEVKKESLKLLISIKEKFQLENVDKCSNEMDFKKDIISLSKKLNLKITFSKLLNTWQKLKDKKEVIDAHKSVEEVISVLAELLSRFVEYFRKIADLLILTDVKAKAFSEERAATLKLLAEMFTNEILAFANIYAEEIAENKNGSSALLSDIYLEASNCATLLQSSYNLMLPILQCSAVK
ncbi:protein FAM114A2 [Hydra vulgaris]|uniref:Protein FAM114A2 n=1 Tax=Hydra vulgaris TaxID=6087 RepID=A0ABM4CZW6_HYDVU